MDGSDQVQGRGKGRAHTTTIKHSSIPTTSAFTHCWGLACAQADTVTATEEQVEAYLTEMVPEEEEEEDKAAALEHRKELKEQLEKIAGG